MLRDAHTDQVLRALDPVRSATEKLADDLEQVARALDRFADDVRSLQSRRAGLVARIGEFHRNAGRRGCGRLSWCREGRVASLAGFAWASTEDHCPPSSRIDRIVGAWSGVVMRIPDYGVGVGVMPYFSRIWLTDGTPPNPSSSRISPILNASPFSETNSIYGSLASISPGSAAKDW